jgi:predicted RNase H-like HicB family nuclease
LTSLDIKVNITIKLRSTQKIAITAMKGLTMKYRVLIEQDEEGVFVAEVPALPGCISQGTTRKEALQNIQEAIAAYLESLKAHDEPVPPSIHEEVIEVSG